MSRCSDTYFSSAHCASASPDASQSCVNHRFEHQLMSWKPQIATESRKIAEKWAKFLAGKMASLASVCVNGCVELDKKNSLSSLERATWERRTEKNLCKNRKRRNCDFMMRRVTFAWTFVFSALCSVDGGIIAVPTRDFTTAAREHFRRDSSALHFMGANAHRGRAKRMKGSLASHFRLFLDCIQKNLTNRNAENLHTCAPKTPIPILSLFFVVLV